MYVLHKNAIKITLFEKWLPYFRKYPKPDDNTFYRNVAFIVGRGK